MRRATILASVIAAVLSATACGYALAGRGNALPEKIKIIGVPQFVNRSATPGVDQALTDAVREEFQNKGKYLVKPDDGGVDALLTAAITTVTIQPSAFTADRQPSSYVIVVVASVEFKDLTDPAESGGKILWANPSFRLTDDYQVTSGVVDTAALASGNPQALERLAKKFAKDVVTSIFEAF